LLQCAASTGYELLSPGASCHRNSSVNTCETISHSSLRSSDTPDASTSHELYVWDEKLRVYLMMKLFFFASAAQPAELCEVQRHWFFGALRASCVGAKLAISGRGRQR